MIILYDSMTTNFNNNGLGVLSDVISCEVMEERNGLFELELEHLFDDREKWKNLVEDNIIKAPTPTGEQLFRIYRKYKSMSGIRVFARHIFYDLIDNFLEDCRPENTDGTGALSRILSSTQYPHKFTSISDVPGLKTAYFVRKNPVEAIFSEDGVLGRWGGELERDNFLIKLLQSRGKDRGVTIRYGKNLLGIEEDLDLDTVITRLMPQGYDGLFLPEKYIDSTFINNYPHPKIRKIEYSDIKVDEENGITEAMAITQLRERAQKEFSVNKVDIPAANYKIDFIELSKTEEYKNYAVLERVYLCDTVTIKHLKLGFDLKAKVIKYKYNCLTNRYIEIELGAFKESMVSALNSLSSLKGTVDNLLQNAVTGTKMQMAIDHATELLTGALGGYVIFRPKDKPVEILIMDTDDMLTAQKVWRWNLNGLGYSNKGVNGPYETAMTMDGFIIGKFIEAYSITANQVSSDFGQKLDLSSNEGINLRVSKAIDEVQIGGTNLLEKSDTEEFKKSIDETSGGYNQFIQFDITHVDNKINVGDIVTISFDVQMTTGTILKVYDTNNTKDKKFGGKDFSNIGNKRVRLSWTTTVTAGAGTSKHSLDFYNNNNGDKFIIEKIKIEKGNKATDYSLAPEDFYTYVDGIEIGGRNLYAVNTVGKYASGNVTAKTSAISIEGYKISVSSNPTDIIGNVIENLGTEIIISGKTNATALRSYYRFSNGTQQNIIPTVTNGYFQFKLTVPSGATYLNLGLGEYPYTKPYYIENVKVENGNKVTDFSPAPEDVQANIDRVNGLVTDITSDGLVTPLEKRSLKKEWDTIVAEKPTIEAQATINVISSTDQSLVTQTTLTTEKTAYTNAYNSLNTELTPLLADLTVNTSVNSATLRDKFKTYYSAKELLLKAVIDKLNANTSVVASRFKQAEVKLTKESISLAVSDTYTTKTEFTNMEIGTKNIFYNSSMRKNADRWSMSGGVFVTNIDGYDCIKFAGALNTTKYISQELSKRLIPNQSYTVSAWVKVENIVKGTVNSYIALYSAGYWNNNGTNTWFSYGAKDINTTVSGWQYVYFTITTDQRMSNIISYNFDCYLRDFTGNVYVRDLKLEKGTRPTDWSPAPEDIDSKITGLTFTNIENVSVDGDTITAIGGAENGWDKTCNSIEKIGNGQYVEYTIAVANLPTMVGLNVLNSQANYTDIDFAWYTSTSNTLQIYEEGSKVSDEGTYAVGDVFRIAVENGKVNYYQNGELKHTSTRTPTLPLFVDMSFYNKYGKITGIKIGTMLSGVAEKLVSHESRIYSAEQKITASAIVATVKASTEWTTQTNNISNAIDIAKAMSNGKMLFTDPMFKTTLNNCAVYNNSANGTVTTTRIAKPSDCPTTSAYCLQVKTTGSASPGWGGFVQNLQSRANAKFILKMIAKIPVGYTLNLATNTMGTGYTDKLITSNVGTGNYEEYIRVIECGSTTPFSSGGHFYLSGGTTPTTSAPLTWYVAYCTVFDITDGDYGLVDVESRVSTAESTIEQQATQISSKVDVNGVKSTIEQNPTSVKIAFNKINTNIQTDEGGIFSIKNGALKVYNTRGNAYLLTGYNANGDNYVYTQGRYQASMEPGRTYVYPDGTTAVNKSATNMSPFGIEHENSDGREMYIRSNTNVRLANLGNTMDRALNLFELNGTTVRTFVVEGKRVALWQNCVDATGTTDKNLWLNKTAGDQVVVGNGANTGWGHLSAGSIYVTGSKNCVQDTENYGMRAINAYETAEYYFGDIGSGQLVDKKCVIWIEDIFKEVVNVDMNYQVFLSKYGRGDIWISERTPNYFVVEGENDIEFGWELKAKRKGFETSRLEIIENKPEIDMDFKIEEEDQRDMNETTVTDYYLTEMNSGVFTNSEMNFNELEQNTDLTLSEFNYNSDNLLDEYDKYLMEGLM